MPDKWAQYAAPSQPAPDKWAQFAAPSSSAPVSDPYATNDQMPAEQHSVWGTIAHGASQFIGASPIGQAASAFAAIPGAIRHPIDTVTGAAKSIYQGFDENYQGMKADAQHGDIAGAWSHFIGTIPAVGPALKEAGERLGNAFAGKLNDQTGQFEVDPYEVSGAVGNAAGLAWTTATALNPKGAAKDAKAAAKNIAGTAADGSKRAVNVAKSLTEKAIDLNDRNASPGKMIMSGLRGSATRPGMMEHLDNYALPALKEASESTGRAIHGIDDLITTADATDAKKPGLIDVAKKDVQAKITARTDIQKAGGMMIDGKTLGDSLLSTITEKMKIENPSKVAEIQRMAGEYSKRQFTVDEAYGLLGDTNDELDTYYGKNPTARRVAEGSNPDIAHQVALGNSLRDTLYKWDSDPAIGDELRTLRKQYGTLTELEDGLYRRRNVALRQAPMNLSSQLSKWSSIGQLANGVSKIGTFLVSENPGAKFASGLADVGKATSQLTVAKWMQDYISTDSLIKRAFSKPIKPSPVQ